MLTITQQSTLFVTCSLLAMFHLLIHLEVIESFHHRITEQQVIRKKKNPDSSKHWLEGKGARGNSLKTSKKLSNVICPTFET